MSILDLFSCRVDISVTTLIGDLDPLILIAPATVTHISNNP